MSFYDVDANDTRYKLFKNYVNANTSDKYNQQLKTFVSHKPYI